MTDYLTFAELIAIHQDLIERFGGTGGLRDPGALESALFRPQCGYYEDRIEEAAALWESLAQNHPFIDGNKRVAFAAVYTFLRINGVLIVSHPIKTFEFIMQLYETKAFHFDRLAAWLRKHTRLAP